MSSAGLTISMNSREQALMNALNALERKFGAQEKQLQKVTDKAKALEQGFRDSGKEANQAGVNIGRTAQNAIRSLASMAAGVLSIQTAWNLAQQALADYEQMKDRAAQRAISDEGGLALLGQLAAAPGQSEEQALRQRIGKARELHRMGATETLGQAGLLRFSLESAGFAEEDIQMFGQIGGQKLAKDVLVFAESIDSLTRAIGAAETGSARDLVNKAFGVSAFSKATGEQILAGSARAGPGARTLGISDEEVLAAVAVTASPLKTADIAGTRLASLFRDIEASTRSKDLKGLTLDEMVDKLAAADAEGKIKEYITSQEAIQIARVLAGGKVSDDFAKATTAADAAVSADVLAGKLAAGGAIPELGAPAARRRAAATLTQAEDTFGPRELNLDTLRDMWMTGARASGMSEIDIFTQRPRQPFWVTDEQFRHDLIQAIEGRKEQNEDFRRAIEQFSDVIERNNEQSRRTLGSPDRDR